MLQAAQVHSFSSRTSPVTEPSKKGSRIEYENDDKEDIAYQKSVVRAADNLDDTEQNTCHEGSLQISETAGLGMQAEDVLVPQLHNLHAEEITYTKTGKTAENEIDAISGATITTKAVTNAVNGALRYASYLIAQEGGAM